jgi:carbonic anhydrase
MKAWSYQEVILKRNLPVLLVATLVVALFMLSACDVVSSVQPVAESVLEDAVESIAEPTAALEAADAATEPAAEGEASEPAAEHATTGTHFTYEGEDGPEHWASLSLDNADCAGRHQSPIDLTTAGAQDLANLVFQYQPSRIKIVNNGHTIQVTYDAGSTIELDGHRYKLLQFHFHAPSEHTINGQLAAAELHLVHEIDDGSLPAGSKAVVGVLIQEGADNPAFTPVWDNLYVATATEQTVDGEVNAAAMLPAVQTTYRYAGSLTTPPCTENVAWNVMTEPIEMSSGQLDAFRGVFEGANNRPVQPINDRELAVDSTP